jgi:hypothetical protein
MKFYVVLMALCLMSGTTFSKELANTSRGFVGPVSKQTLDSELRLFAKAIKKQKVNSKDATEMDCYTDPLYSHDIQAVGRSRVRYSVNGKTGIVEAFDSSLIWDDTKKIWTASPEKEIEISQITVGEEIAIRFENSSFINYVLDTGFRPVIATGKRAFGGVHTCEFR